jgi:outer membrane lipoprotein-sorting protein
MSQPSRRAALIALSAGALAALAIPSFAAASPETDAQVAQASAYLDGLVSVKSHFTQTDQRGSVAQGTVYLARPGRARFEYDPPSGLLITSDGKTVIVSDSRLKTFQRFPLSSTPLAVFLAQHIRLDRGARITRVDPQPGGYSITARDARALSQGEITLYFTDHPMKLLGWAVVDAQGRTTRVSLGPLGPASPSAELFVQTPAPKGPAG